METLVVELTHKNALQLLLDLEALDVIRLHGSRQPVSEKLSKKYRGMLTQEESQDLNNHVDQMRDEWSNI